MSSFILKYYSKKLCAKSYYQFNKNLHILANKIRIMENPSKLKQKQIVSINYLQFRGTTTPSITIKEYKTSRKYTKIWKLERLMGWSLIVLIPLAFTVESKELEMILVAIGLTHTYCGCQSMCSDYLRSSVVGKILPIIMRINIVVLTVLSLMGYYQLIYKDVGLINMIKKFWFIRGQDYKSNKNLHKTE